MATSRLRKTFQYPDEAEDEDALDDLDEEAQEELISTLRTRDETTSLFYRRAFLALPLLAIIAYIPTSIASSRVVLFDLLSITSLLSTAYILHFIPPKQKQPPDPKGKRPLYLMRGQDDGPINQYLPWLDGALGAFIALLGLLSWRKGAIDAGDTWRAVLPGIIFAVVMLAREQLAPLDVDGLERLKYDYKGA